MPKVPGRLKHPAVVLVTGSQSSVSQEEAKVEGAESLILKPFALATILDLVRGLVEPAPPGITASGVADTLGP
jgi:CheY-like chemotaxis protein